MTHYELDKLISGLNSHLNGIFQLGSPAQRAKDAWAQVKHIGAQFKEVRYPSRTEKDAAWQRFQGLVQQLKAQADEHQRWRKEHEEDSLRVRDKIISAAESALPDGFVAGLLNMPFQMIEEMGRRTFGMKDADPWKQELQRRGDALRSASEKHKSNSRHMLRHHNQEAWQRLQEVRQKLNDDWDAYNSARQTAFESNCQARQEKQAAWRENQNAYIERLRSILDKQEDYLAKKEDELSRNRDQYSSAYSDSFRDRCRDWIEQCEAKIREVEEGIRDLRRKISEAEDKL